MIKKLSVVLMIVAVTASSALAGGWDTDKGLDKVTLTGELVCIGCSLKKLDGANAQCDLYAHHAIGFKAGDGTLWSLVDNAIGHDVINAHVLLEHKQATLTGWMYPLAHYIEIDGIDVEGVTLEQIQQTGWEEDQLKAKRLVSRKVGETPEIGHSHDHE